jgi:hypothetical protein
MGVLRRASMPVSIGAIACPKGVASTCMLSEPASIELRHPELHTALPQPEGMSILKVQPHLRWQVGDMRWDARPRQKCSKLITKVVALHAHTSTLKPCGQYGFCVLHITDSMQEKHNQQGMLLALTL